MLKGWFSKPVVYGSFESSKHLACLAENLYENWLITIQFKVLENKIIVSFKFAISQKFCEFRIIGLIRYTEVPELKYPGENMVIKTKLE